MSNRSVDAGYWKVPFVSKISRRRYVAIGTATLILLIVGWVSGNAFAMGMGIGGALTTIFANWRRVHE